MIENEYYGQEGHGPYELHSIGDLQLEEGGTIRNCQLAVATFGSLNAPRDNAILVPTRNSGTSKIMEQVYIGKGRALDPESTSSSPSTRSAAGYRRRRTTRRCRAATATSLASVSATTCVRSTSC